MINGVLPTLLEDIEALVDARRHQGHFITSSEISALGLSILLDGQLYGSMIKGASIGLNFLTCETIPASFFSGPCFVLTIKPVLEKAFTILDLKFDIDYDILSEIYFYYKKATLEHKLNKLISKFSNGQETVKLSSIKLGKTIKKACNYAKISILNFQGISISIDFWAFLHYFLKNALVTQDLGSTILADIKSGKDYIKTDFDKITDEATLFFLSNADEYNLENLSIDDGVKRILKDVNSRIRNDEYRLKKIIAENTPYIDFETDVCIDNIAYLLSKAYNFNIDKGRNYNTSSFLNSIETMLQNMRYSPANSIHTYYGYIVNSKYCPSCFYIDKFGKHLLLYPFVQSIIGFSKSTFCILGLPKISLEHSYTMWQIIPIFSQMIVSHISNLGKSENEVLESSKKSIWNLIHFIFFPDLKKGYNTLYDSYTSEDIKSMILNQDAITLTFLPQIYKDILSIEEKYLSIEHIRIINAILIHYLIKCLIRYKSVDGEMDIYIKSQLENFNFYRELEATLQE